jgi:hypothetical protein
MAILLCLWIQAATPPEPRLQEAPKAAAEPVADSREAGPAGRDLRESTGLFVFLAWMWLAIGVLVVVLGMKIREADRLHEAGFFMDGPDP